MADLQDILKAIDELDAKEFEQLYDYVAQRRRTMRWWVVPPENIAKIREAVLPLQEDSAKLTEEEINAIIDEAIAEVRLERRNRQSRD
jgi:hypothetical protein